MKAKPSKTAWKFVPAPSSFSAQEEGLLFLSDSVENLTLCLLHISLSGMIFYFILWMTDFCLSLKSHLNVTFPTIITNVGHSLLLFFFSLAHLSHSVIIQLLCDYLINGCISAKCWIPLGPRPSYIFVSRSSLSQRFVLGTWHSAWYSNVGIKYSLNTWMWAPFVFQAL